MAGGKWGVDAIIKKKSGCPNPVLSLSDCETRSGDITRTIKKRRFGGGGYGGNLELEINLNAASRSVRSGGV